MIRHDDIIINENRWIDSRNAFYSGINDFSISGEMRFRRAAGSRPYGNIRQDAAPILCADCDKIGAGAAVVILVQTYLFPLWQSHDPNLRSRRRGGNLPPMSFKPTVGAAIFRPFLSIIPQPRQRNRRPRTSRNISEHRSNIYRTSMKMMERKHTSLHHFLLFQEKSDCFFGLFTL